MTSPTWQQPGWKPVSLRRRGRMAETALRRGASDHASPASKADRFIVDPHKWFFAPYDCCALLYRDPRTARAAHPSTRATWIRSIGRRGTSDLRHPADPSRRGRRSGSRYWFVLARTSLSGSGRAPAVDSPRRRRRIQRPCSPRTGQTPLNCPFCCSAGAAGTPLTTKRGRRLRHWTGRSCVPTTWRGQTVLRLERQIPTPNRGRVLDVLDAMR